MLSTTTKPIGPFCYHCFDFKIAPHPRSQQGELSDALSQQCIYVPKAGSVSVDQQGTVILKPETFQSFPLCAITTNPVEEPVLQLVYKNMGPISGARHHKAHQDPSLSE